MDISQTLNKNFKRRIQILKELGNDVIVEEQSDNFGQSSKGQASQTEAQRQTSGFGRLCRKIQYMIIYWNPNFKTDGASHPILFTVMVLKKEFIKIQADFFYLSLTLFLPALGGISPYMSIT